MENKSVSWGWVIFWIIVFWPIGLVLIIKKFADDKSALMSGKRKFVSFIAWVFIAIGAMGLYMAIFVNKAENRSLLILIVFLAGGLLLRRKTDKVNKTAVTYKKYIDLVINQNYRSIDAIASAVGLPYDKVVMDLQNMIDMGYLKKAYINMGSRIIEFIQPIQQTPAPATGQSRPSEQTVPVRCPDCGAKNVAVAGKVTECEYCGNPIKV